VRNELGGSIAWLAREGGGTSVVIEAQLRQGRDAATVA
jgi:two-component system, sensor histidine kinase PdtaS